MSHVINKNPHPAYVRDPDSGELVHIAEGAVREADGAFLDALLATNGIESASSTDVKKASAQSAAASGDATPTPAARINEVLGDARALAQRVLAATNSIVIGDDQAPHGPPSGTVTTKQALAKTDPVAFAENEAITIGKVDAPGVSGHDLASGATAASSADVHNAQVEAQEATGEVAAALAALHSETVSEREAIDADEDDDDSDDDSGDAPESDGEPTGDNYDDLSVPQLKEELGERELSKYGTKEALIARLREADAANDETV